MMMAGSSAGRAIGGGSARYGSVCAGGGSSMRGASTRGGGAVTARGAGLGERVAHAPSATATTTIVAMRVSAASVRVGGNGGREERGKLRNVTGSKDEAKDPAATGRPE